jgi:hypothetical protein
MGLMSLIAFASNNVGKSIRDDLVGTLKELVGTILAIFLSPIPQ